MNWHESWGVCHSLWSMDFLNSLAFGFLHPYYFYCIWCNQCLSMSFNLCLIHVLQSCVYLVQPKGLVHIRYFFAHFQKSFTHFLNIWQFCPLRGLIAQTIVHFAHFQVQGRRTAHQAVTVQMYAVKFLYTTIFHIGLNIATHCFIVVRQCFIQDQSDTSAVTWSHCPWAATWSHCPCTLSSFCIHLSHWPQRRQPCAS